MEFFLIALCAVNVSWSFKNFKKYRRLKKKKSKLFLIMWMLSCYLMTDWIHEAWVKYAK